jgi:hypothetical protein
MPDNIIISERSGNYQAIALWALVLLLTLGFAYMYTTMVSLQASVGELQRTLAELPTEPVTVIRPVGELTSTDYNEAFVDEVVMSPDMLKLEQQLAATPEPQIIVPPFPASSETPSPNVSTFEQSTLDINQIEPALREGFDPNRILPPSI